MSETVIGYATGANDMLQGLHTQAQARRFHLRNHKSETWPRRFNELFSKINPHKRLPGAASACDKLIKRIYHGIKRH
jgi:hypothetical protein